MFPTRKEMNRSPSNYAKLMISGAVTIFGALTAYRFGHLAAYHFWLAGGPPNLDPVAHADRADLFGWVTLGCLILTVLALWVFTRAVRQALTRER